jgi:hypothetical protein
MVGPEVPMSKLSPALSVLLLVGCTGHGPDALVIEERPAQLEVSRERVKIDVEVDVDVDLKIELGGQHTCSGGGCTVTCAGDEACDFTCSGGGCTRECAGARCHRTCSGHGCTDQD